MHLEAKNRTAALYAEYAKRKAAAAAGKHPTQPGALPTPNTSEANPATDPVLSVEPNPNRPGTLEDPDLRRKLISTDARRVGDQNDQAKQAYIESVMNRAVARNLSLDSTISSLHDPRTDTGYYPLSTISKLSHTPSQAERDKLNQIIDRVLAGSNLASYATGSESGVGVHSSGAPVVFNPGTGERFVIENDDADWASKVRSRSSQASPRHADTRE